MYRDCTLHFRRKVKFNGKLAGATSLTYVDCGLIIGKPTEDEKNLGYEIGSNGGLTISIIKDGDDLKWGFSKCNLCDPYNRKLGRIKSMGRADGQEKLITNDMTFDCVRKLAIEFAQDIEDSGMNNFMLQLEDGTYTNTIHTYVTLSEEDLKKEKLIHK